MKTRVMPCLLFAFVAIHSHGDTAAGKKMLQRGDYAGAQAQFRKSAEAGESEALFLLGRMMDNGWGVIRNEKAAIEWYKKAAENGYPDAQNALGMKLYVEQPERTGKEIVVELFRKSAEQGFSPGQYNYGLMYQLGWGVEKNEEIAQDWFRKAADQNEPAAFFRLGYAHEQGIGAIKDETKAAYWYRKGAELYEPMSQNSLGVMYSTGRGGLPLSVPEMLKLINASASQGYGTAMFNLGLIYEKGLGVPTDYVAAHSWFNLASSRGVVEAASARGAIEKSMSVEQIAQAQRFSREWRSKPVLEALPDHNKKIKTAKFGTGFFVSSTGLLLTNYHVVEGCKQILISPDGLPARLVAKDSRNDLALLAISSTTTFARFRSGTNIRPGEEIVVIGYPLRGTLGSGASVTTGVVSSLGGIGDDTSKLQISAPVQSGNSGGPVIDTNGNVVGIVYGKMNALDFAIKTGDIPQNVNFAINLPTIIGFLDAHNVDYQIAPADIKPVRNKSSLGKNAQHYSRVVECIE